MNVRLVAHTPRPLYVCAEAASVCYKSEPDLKIIKGCIKSGHTSVLEHASFTFRIEGISRTCSHQLVRHRIASYSQESQRYVKYDDCDWVIDNIYYDARQKILLSCANSIASYKEMLEDGVPSDDARAVLPNATPTTIYITMNIRSLMNFFNERLCARASKEIRNVAHAMKKSIISSLSISDEEKKIFENLFVPKCEKYPVHFCPESQCCGMHVQLKNLTEKKIGHWIKEESDTIYCSNCGEGFDGVFTGSDFCPKCGADMRGI